MSTQSDAAASGVQPREELQAHYQRVSEPTYSCADANVFGHLSKDWLNKDRRTAGNIRDLEAAFAERSGHGT
jgi:hypothetical protein